MSGANTEDDMTIIDEWSNVKAPPAPRHWPVIPKFLLLTQFTQPHSYCRMLSKI